MIINVQNKQDIITVDFRLNQIRYVKDLAKRGSIQFHDMSVTESECYVYLFNNKRATFFECLIEEVMNNFEGVMINQTDLKVITEREYLQLCEPH